MRVLIDIDENLREQLFDIVNSSLNIPLGLQSIMIMAIVNGTPLPEHYGRLIDAEVACPNHTECVMCPVAIECPICAAPTIIPATKEGAE